MFWYSEVWNDFERGNFLRQLVLKLDARQHYFMFTCLAVSFLFIFSKYFLNNFYLTRYVNIETLLVFYPNI